MVVLVAPFFYYGINVVEYDGDFAKAWQDFLGKTPNWNTKLDGPIPAKRPRFVMPGIVLTVLVYGTLLGILPVVMALLKRMRKHPANGVLHLSLIHI